MYVPVVNQPVDGQSAATDGQSAAAIQSRNQFEPVQTKFSTCTLEQHRTEGGRNKSQLPPVFPSPGCRQALHCIQSSIVRRTTTL